MLPSAVEHFSAAEMQIVAFALGRSGTIERVAPDYPIIAQAIFSAVMSWQKLKGLGSLLAVQGC